MFTIFGQFYPILVSSCKDAETICHVLVPKGRAQISPGCSGASAANVAQPWERSPVTIQKPQRGGPNKPATPSPRGTHPSHPKPNSTVVNSSGKITSPLKICPASAIAFSFNSGLEKPGAAWERINRRTPAA